MSKLNDLEDYEDTIEEIDSSDEGQLTARPGSFEVISLDSLDLELPEDVKKLQCEVLNCFRRLMIDNSISARVRKESAIEVARMLRMYPEEKPSDKSGVNVQMVFSRPQLEQIGAGMGILSTSAPDFEILDLEDDFAG